MATGNEMVEYDEMSMFGENAEEFGIPYDGPPAVRRAFVDVERGRRVSALVWGEAPAELVFLHGGAQNAHTWDTVALALGRPLVAIDLPGHGHSEPGRNGTLDVKTNADDIAAAVRELAPAAMAVIGMSLGGMTTLALADTHPDLVKAVVLVDVTPGVTSEKSKSISDFVNGPPTFASFDALLARTVEHNPTRTVSSLRRGILHNARQREDGTWVWRYGQLGQPDRHPDFTGLWDAVARLAAPLLLVRGMRSSSVVDDADEAEVLRRQPSAKVVHVEDAGHSVQGDTPVELARIIDDFTGGQRP
jgi:pimeloyl-ACP methyl ester carboxylesterase